jgi:hypothetical protein
MKRPACIFLFSLCFLFTNGQLLPGFKPTGIFNEQEIMINNHWPNVVANINAPMKIDPKKKTYLVFYALPNGNSIEWTKGKKMQTSDDWHFDIQHIAAQTRFVRNTDKKCNYVVVYLMAAQKSWPAWKRSTPDSLHTIKNIIDSITGIFQYYGPAIVLNSHSGGGSFIIGFIDAVKDIPNNIERIAFLDSDYGYEDSLHKNKLTQWLENSGHHKLLVLAYNDSLVIFNGKPLVSATGGTWYRSRLMQRGLSESFYFTTHSDTAFIKQEALHKRATFVLKENPNGLIYHTVQVERNGFIFSLFSATKFDKKKYFTYFGKRIYENYINE